MKEKKLLKHLKESGYKVTPQRQEIIRVLCREEGGCRTAGEILREVRSNYPGMSLDTVYRNLGLLRNLNIVEEINFKGKSRYELKSEDAHHHHLICIKCGGLQKLNFCPLQYIDWNKLPDGGFKVKEHRFELFGYCSACLNKDNERGQGKEGGD